MHQRMKEGFFMNNRFGYYGQIDGRLMCFATEDEYYEYKEDVKSERNSDKHESSNDES